MKTKDREHSRNSRIIRRMRSWEKESLRAGGIREVRRAEKSVDAETS